MTGMFIVVLVLNLLKGGGAYTSPLGIRCGSTPFWLTAAFILLWSLIVSFWVRQNLIAQWRLKDKVSE